ncbi:hypothetical protein CUJ83_04480 [Methanocella sp. CWC-04]|uniref:Uncharacterized protein n=1 Tax=Methanooceanicella nereidis TaxID=2052831 RepID=A0AAP2W5M7_9EURY|nr:hypothetical protein [Methanocella sp. CWC-04]MCD1294252.1 hypothetical protein [Methanocella sp. CWC-04]
MAYQSDTVFHSSGAPVIYGDEDFKSNVNFALEYLKNNYPDSYSSVNHWITEIRPTEKYTCINNLGICYVDEEDISASYVWLAGVLIHEAKHTGDDNTYFLDKEYSHEISERRAIYEQAAFLADANGWSEEDKIIWAESCLDSKFWITIPAEYGETI